MANSLVGEAKIAFRLLKASYELARLRQRELQAQEVGRRLGLSDTVTYRAYDFLLQRNFVKPLAKDVFTVSDKGRDAVEWELARPSFLSEQVFLKE